MIKLNNDSYVTVKGVFEDLPNNCNIFDAIPNDSAPSNLKFVAPWELYVASNDWVKIARDQNLWDNKSYLLYVLLYDKSATGVVNNKIKNTLNDHVPDGTKQRNPQLFLHPMSDWHLRSSFKEGRPDGGSIQYVQMFGIIGVFVLLLACINFMNLATARAQKRAKEVGIRKTVGSNRNQLIGQFMLETMLVTLFAIVLS